MHSLESRTFGVNIKNARSIHYHSNTEAIIDTAIAELGLEVRDVRNCLDIVQEIVNFITASPKRLQCIDVAYMYICTGLFTLPSRIDRGLARPFPCLISSCLCKTEGVNPQFVSSLSWFTGEGGAETRRL